jgi:hypothetical protein
MGLFDQVKITPATCLKVLKALFEGYVIDYSEKPVSNTQVKMPVVDATNDEKEINAIEKLNADEEPKNNIGVSKIGHADFVLYKYNTPSRFDLTLSEEKYIDKIKVEGGWFNDRANQLTLINLDTDEIIDTVSLERDPNNVCGENGDEECVYKDGIRDSSTISQNVFKIKQSAPARKYIILLNGGHYETDYEVRGISVFHYTK